MKAYYREIKVGFVLELRRILLHTAAIFVPQGDEKSKFETRTSPEFSRNRKLVRYKSTNSEKIPQIRNRENRNQQAGKRGAEKRLRNFTGLKIWTRLSLANQQTLWFIFARVSGTWIERMGENYKYKKSQTWPCIVNQLKSDKIKNSCSNFTVRLPRKCLLGAEKRKWYWRNRVGKTFHRMILGILQFERDNKRSFMSNLKKNASAGQQKT